jgi:hypothetical protein
MHAPSKEEHEDTPLLEFDKLRDLKEMKKRG